MFLALKSLGSSNYDQLPSPIFHHPHQECWRQAESPKTTVTTYPLLLRKPTPNQTTKKKSKQKNLKSKKEKNNMEPSNHPTIPHTPKIHPSYPISFCFRIHLVHLCGAFRLAGRLWTSLQGRLTAKIRSKAFLGELFPRWNLWSWIYISH